MNDDWSGPRVVSRRAVLKVPTPAMFEHLRQLQLETLGPKWRFRGSHPSPPEFQRLLYDGTLCSFVIMPRPRSESSATTAPIVGLATCFNVFPHDGHAEFALARLTNGPSRVFFEGAMLFVNYLFECWPFRKLYVEVAEYNLSQMEFMLGEVGMVEGRLLNYFWANGQHWDKVIVSIERGRWETFSESHPVPND